MRKMRKSSVLSQKVGAAEALGQCAGRDGRAWAQVDLSKVNMEVMNGWIEQRVTELLGFEDDVLIDMVSNLLTMKVRRRAHGARWGHRRPIRRAFSPWRRPLRRWTTLQRCSCS